MEFRKPFQRLQVETVETVAPYLTLFITAPKPGANEIKLIESNEIQLHIKQHTSL